MTAARPRTRFRIPVCMFTVISTARQENSGRYWFSCRSRESGRGPIRGRGGLRRPELPCCSHGLLSVADCRSPAEVRFTEIVRCMCPIGQHRDQRRAGAGVTDLDVESGRRPRRARCLAACQATCRLSAGRVSFRLWVWSGSGVPVLWNTEGVMQSTSSLVGEHHGAPSVRASDPVEVQQSRGERGAEWAAEMMLLL